MSKLKALVVGVGGELVKVLQGMEETGIPELEVSAATWQEALRLAHTEKYHGIFIDPQFSEGDGLVFASQARGAYINRSTPVIITSTRTGQAAIEQALEIGGTVFLKHPFERDEVLFTLKLMDRSASEARRRAIRIPINAPVYYRMLSHSLSGTAQNISVDGMLLDSKIPTVLLQTVHFSIRLPDAEPDPITAVGRVVHQGDQCQLGIQFTGMDSGARQRLSRLVAS